MSQPQQQKKKQPTTLMLNILYFLGNAEMMQGLLKDIIFACEMFIIAVSSCLYLELDKKVLFFFFKTREDVIKKNG